MAFDDNCSQCTHSVNLYISPVLCDQKSVASCLRSPITTTVCHQIAINLFNYYCFHSCSLHLDLFTLSTVLFPYITCNLSLTDCPSPPLPHEQTANGAQIGPFSLYSGAGDPRHPHFLEGKPLIYARRATSGWHRQSVRSHTHCCCFRHWAAEETPSHTL
jgi:hypothetical protein